MAYSYNDASTQTILTPKSSIYATLDNLNELLPYALKDVNIDYTRKDAVIQNPTQLLLYGFDAINNMILNVIYTRIGERDFEPTFGSNALNLIHEPNDGIVTNQVEIELYDRIREWVPYIDIALSGIICRSIPREQTYALYFIYTERVTGIKNTFSTYLSNLKKVY